ncbi:MAG TPA: ATPase, T2SS/T4P/T4SS family, partial [Polyangia bacterium]|nr:ATPase, T2SS/T4P/T4SS family [Polyangia bacterium]
PPVKPPSEPPRIPSGAVPPPRPMAPPRMPQAAREVSEREPSGPLPTGAPPRRPGPVAVPAPPPTAASTSPSAMRPAVPEPIRKPTSQREGARAQSEGSLAAPVPRGGRPIDIQRAVFDRLSEMMDLRRVELSRLGDEEFWEKAENTICDIVETMEAAGSIPKSIDQDALIKDVLNEALGLGPLEDMLADSEVTQILVVRADQIYVERGGRIVASERSFSSERALLRVIERMLSRRPDDRGAPIGEGRLADGSRFVAMLPPVAVRGPCVGIRKPHREAATLDGLVGREVLSKSMAEFLELALRARRNIVVSGGVGAGQPQLLGALGRALPPDERVVSIEDVSTLDLSREHWVALEAHPPQVGVRELLHGALRLRPDRLVVGDVRGAEALELVQAMATGSDGTLVGMHGSSPRETLSRLETLMEVGGHSLPTQVARSLITQAVSLVVQMVRLPDGARRVSHIAELTGLADGGFELNDVFAWKADGTGPDGVRGRFLASGFVPKFCEDLSRRGVQINQAIFKE